MWQIYKDSLANITRRLAESIANFSHKTVRGVGAQNRSSDITIYPYIPGRTVSYDMAEIARVLRTRLLAGPVTASPDPEAHLRVYPPLTLIKKVRAEINTPRQQNGRRSCCLPHNLSSCYPVDSSSSCPLAQVLRNVQNQPTFFPSTEYPRQVS